MEQSELSSGSHFSELAYERRRKARTQAPIPAKVHGVDSAGKAFDLDTNLDNLSAGGLYVRVTAHVEERSPLSVSFFLPSVPGRESNGTHWEAMGVIRRVEPQEDGSNGLGIEFTSYRQI